MQKYLIIDFDSTFIQTETLDELSKICLRQNTNSKNILSKIETITHKAMNGEIAFKDALNNRLKLINITLEDIENLICKIKNDITESISQNIKFFTQYHEFIYVVSGGFEDVIKPIVYPFKIREDHIIANSFIYKNSNVVGCNQKSELLKNKGKVLAINKLNLNGEIIVVGDGYTDYEVKEYNAAQKFIAFTENISRESVVKKADIVADNFNVVINEFLK